MSTTPQRKVFGFLPLGGGKKRTLFARLGPVSSSVVGTFLYLVFWNGYKPNLETVESALLAATLAAIGAGCYGAVQMGWWQNRPAYKDWGIVLDLLFSVYAASPLLLGVFKNWNAAFSWWPSTWLPEFDAYQWAIYGTFFIPVIADLILGFMGAYKMGRLSDETTISGRTQA